MRLFGEACIGELDHPPNDAIGDAEVKQLSKARGAIGYQGERKERFPLLNFFVPTQSNSCVEFLEPGAKPLTTFMGAAGNFNSDLVTYAKGARSFVTVNANDARTGKRPHVT
jgi:hypothetical protein